MSCAVKMVNCGQLFFYSMKNNCAPSKLCNRMKSARDITLFRSENRALAIYLAFQDCSRFHKEEFFISIQTFLNIMFLIDLFEIILLLLKSNFLAICFYLKKIVSFGILAK